MPTTTTNSGFSSFISAVQTQILNPVIILLTVGAFVIFIWGVIEYIRNADNDEARKTGQQHILWGIIGLVIIFGVQAIVGFIGAVANQVF